MSCGWQRKWKDDFTAADGKAVSTVSWENEFGKLFISAAKSDVFVIRRDSAKEWDKMSQCSKELFLRFGLDELKKEIRRICPVEKNNGLRFVLHSEKRQIIIFWMSRPKEWMQKSKKIFGELLKEWTKMEKSIVMVSHDMEFTAKYADEISLLYQGRNHCAVSGERIYGRKPVLHDRDEPGDQTGKSTHNNH